jgi:hypothetical protein
MTRKTLTQNGPVYWEQIKPPERTSEWIKLGGRVSRARLRTSEGAHGAGCTNDRDRAGESEDRHSEPRLQHAPLRLTIRETRRGVSGRGREGRHTT